jgi:hypothetical protein
MTYPTYLLKVNNVSSKVTENPRETRIVLYSVCLSKMLKRATMRSKFLNKDEVITNNTVTLSY